ncbi:translation initiation factor IF-2 [Fictibacillus phosphorivorans]|uniref:translation initiation factor IF-2 n=1 Tax=Fictibacillus phosphorivorans TaxID=1221500 RepID=UPI00203AFC68|nr:translation initiation factor IF-2 [Fictibacillus phosphorivorans]MCM3717118.1 translation initiation factor IF-2 [Fictibacillus phosphorivorans]MCM3774805.1 translation initiation factor IF-2 [Fictibacillus phosphorivorans]
MSKIRVYEYAKQKNVQSKDIIEKLKTMDVHVANHMSMIDQAALTKLDEAYRTKAQNDQPAKPKKQNQLPKTDKNRNNSGNDTKSNKKEVQKESNMKIKKETENRNSSQSKSPQTQGSKPGNSNNQNASKNNNSKNNNNRNQNNNRNNNNRNNNNKNQNRNKQNRGGGNQQQSAQKKVLETPSKITFTESLQVGELAKKLNKDTSEIIKKLMGLGIMATINQELDKEAIELIAADYDVEVEEEIIVDETEFENYQVVDDEKDMEVRPPVVTIMGHVDHGKTTLLDAIRNTKVTAGEAGGITQHIGAYQITNNGKKITFLDTPGHAAFTTMRARGAQVTDITILVVAADDGVMPQTVEAINHAKAAGVPIIVAVNKMDKEAANPDRVMQELTEHGLVSEAWGGDTIFVNVSAIKGEGIDDLLEMINLVSEVEELKANPNRTAFGTVIEAQLDKGRGSVATLLVQSGTLNVGDPIVVGHTYGRVRAMVNDLGRRVKSVGPSTPVEITGLNDVPQAGDPFMVFADEKKARQVGEARFKKQQDAQRKESSKLNLDDLFNQIKEGEIKDINVIIKGDVQGSVEALASSLQKIDVEGVKVKIIHSGVGAINEYDIMLASASNAIVIGFNVRPDAGAKRTADAEKVDVRLHRIIYNVIEEIESAMKGMLDPEFEEKVIGQVEVRTTFKVSKVGTIAGCYVTEGKITRDSTVRLIRDGVVIYEGKIDALKRFKDDAKEVAAGYECGITLEKFNDIKEGDIIEAYIMEEIKVK